MLRTCDLFRLYGYSNDARTLTVFDRSLEPVAFFSIALDSSTVVSHIVANCVSDKCLLNREFHVFINNIPLMKLADFYNLKKESFDSFIERSSSIYEDIQNTKRIVSQTFNK